MRYLDDYKFLRFFVRVNTAERNFYFELSPKTKLFKCKSIAFFPTLNDGAILYVW